jgi:hypothetical protein
MEYDPIREDTELYEQSTEVPVYTPTKGFDYPSVSPAISNERQREIEDNISLLLRNLSDDPIKHALKTPLSSAVGCVGDNIPSRTASMSHNEPAEPPVNVSRSKYSPKVGVRAMFQVPESADNISQDLPSVGTSEVTVVADDAPTTERFSRAWRRICRPYNTSSRNARRRYKTRTKNTPHRTGYGRSSSGGRPDYRSKSKTAYDTELRSSRSDNRRDQKVKSELFVRNICFETEWGDLHRLFTSVGEIQDFRLVDHISNGKRRRYATLSYNRDADAKQAMRKLAGRTIDGREIAIRLSSGTSSN